MKKDIRRHSWKSTFFFIQFSFCSGCYILFYFITLQLLRKSAVKINSFLSKEKGFQELKLGQRCQVKVWVRTWLAVVTKKTDLTKWCKKCIPVHWWCHLHSTLVQSRHCEAFEARCTSHPQSSPNSLSKARMKGFIDERKLNDKDIIFHSFKSELLFFVPRKGLRKSSSNWAW